MITIDSRKLQGLDADPWAFPQINFATKIDRARYSKIFFIIEETKKNCLFTRKCKRIVNNFIIMSIKMTQYNSLNVKRSNSQPNKFKSARKTKSDVILRLSSYIIGNFDDKTNFPHELLVTNRQVANLRKDLSHNSSTDIKLPKIQLSKLIQ